MKKLYLSDTDRKIAGVCGGLGDYFGVDSTLIRVIFIVIMVLSFGFGILAYIGAWMVMPRKPKA